MPREKQIAAEGKNCWQRKHSGRVSFLIDAQSYFESFASAAEQARHSIFIIGWDIDSRLILKPGTGNDKNTLGDFLNDIVRKNSKLHIFILTWDFSMIYLFERELMPVFRLDWRTHPRIRFRFDGHHPSGASHHQKIVVIDDAVAFSGGIDLTARRWDTSEHQPDDPRRIDPWGAPYHPFHDVQIAVNGEAAALLGIIARERWRRATGQVIAPAQGGYSTWPAGLEPDMTDVMVMVSRTDPQWEGRHEVREIQTLFFDMIEAAREKIYIEHQYITSQAIGDALAARLEEDNGPEVVIVAPRQCSGWLEQSTMGFYRSKLLQNLRRSDLHGRLHIYCPDRPEMEIHSKVFIVDDNIVRIGSANLSNRSMGLDTECDLTIEAAGEIRTRKAVAAFRSRLLGEHLGISSAEFAEKEREEKSIHRAIDTLGSGTKKLHPLSEHEELDSPLCDIVLCDPERPVDAEKVLAYMLPEDIQAPARGRLMGIIALLAALGAITAAWHWTPLKDWVEPERISALMAPVRYSVAAPIFVLAIYATLGLVVPITFVIISTVLIFDPLPGFFYSLTGCLASAVISYSLGHLLGRDMVRRLGGSSVNRVSRHIVRHGFLAITFLRLGAVAPFTMINIIAGATRIKLKDYVLGTLAGMAPGIFALTLFGDRMGAAIRHPDGESLIVLAAIVILILASGTWLVRRFDRPKNSAAG